MLKGSLVALVTPMHPDGGIDYSTLNALVDWHIASGTDGLAILGTTAESPCIIPEERTNIIQSVIQRVDDRLPVLVGTGTNATQQTIAYSKEAENLGADAVFTVVPCYNKPTQEGLYRHFMAVADTLTIPMILYNHPGRTGTDLLPKTAACLAKHPNIIGIKDATGGVERLKAMQAIGCDLAYYSGDDETALAFLMAGGAGVISVVGNVVPKQFHALCVAALNKEIDKAQAINRQLSVLYKLLTRETNPIPTKWALNRLGRIPSGIRLPLTPFTEAHHDEMVSALEEAGAILKETLEVV